MKFTTANVITPTWCRWDAKNPPPLTIWHCVLYALAGGFFSANLYYSHPILDVIARDFNTTQTGVATIPTLAQAGDATGLLLILPLADFFPRRKFSLSLLSLTVLLWIGLCITKNLAVFSALTYLSAIFTGIVQILIVLVAEQSLPSKRAFNISIVAAGPTLGILLARILSGIVATYIPWRYVYILALALQVLMLVLLYLFMPDYPAKNTDMSTKSLIRSYPKIIVSITTLYFKHPVLTQASLLSFLTFFTVSSFWTTLTFLLSSQPYNYTPFVVGLFGLIGASTMVLGPIYGKYIITPINSPLISAAIGKFVSLTGIVVGTFVGPVSVAGPVIQAVLLDAGLMILQVSSRVTIHGVGGPNMANRVNTAFVVMLYLGMLTGTKVGNEVYEKCGGWVASGGVSIGMIGLGLILIAARGPNVDDKSWLGWSGGWARQPRTEDQMQKDEESVVVESNEVVESAAEEKNAVVAATDIISHSQAEKNTLND